MNIFRKRLDGSVSEKRKSLLQSISNDSVQSSGSRRSSVTQQEAVSEKELWKRRSFVEYAEEADRNRAEQPWVWIQKAIETKREDVEAWIAKERETAETWRVILQKDLVYMGEYKEEPLTKKKWFEKLTGQVLMYFAQEDVPKEFALQENEVIRKKNEKIAKERSQKTALGNEFQKMVGAFLVNINAEKLLKLENEGRASRYEPDVEMEDLKEQMLRNFVIGYRFRSDYSPSEEEIKQMMDEDRMAFNVILDFVEEHEAEKIKSALKSKKTKKQEDDSERLSSELEAEVHLWTSILSRGEKRMSELKEKAALKGGGKESTVLSFLSTIDTSRQQIMIGKAKASQCTFKSVMFEEFLSREIEINLKVDLDKVRKPETVYDRGTVVITKEELIYKEKEALRKIIEPQYREIFENTVKALEAAAEAVE